MGIPNTPRTALLLLSEETVVIRYADNHGKSTCNDLSNRRSLGLVA